VAIRPKGDDFSMSRDRRRGLRSGSSIPRRSCGERVRIVRPDELRAPDVRSHSARISGQKWAARDGGVRADQELGENRLTPAAFASVAGVGVAGQEGGGEGHLLDARHRGEGCSKRLDTREPGRDLGEHYRVDDQRAALGRLGEARLQPAEPAPVFGEDVEQYVAVDEGPYGSAQPLVRARISSVVISTSPRPRMRVTASAAR
jgi:hypothetical protein